MMKTQGLRVFGDTKGQWVRTRRVGTSTYHVTNIGEDGTVPAMEVSNFDCAAAQQFPSERPARGRVRSIRN